MSLGGAGGAAGWCSVVAILYACRTCPVHFFGGAGTNIGRATGRELLQQEATFLLRPTLGAVDLLLHKYCRNVQWFRGELVFEAHRLLYRSAEGSKTF